MARPTKRDIEEAVRELDTINSELVVETEFVTIEDPEDVPTGEFHYTPSEEEGKGE